MLESGGPSAKLHMPWMVPFCFAIALPTRVALENLLLQPLQESHWPQLSARLLGRS